MPGYLVHQGTKVLCLHAGQATPGTTNPHVTVSGQAIVTQDVTYSIAGCTLPPPNAANGPCTSASWVRAALRVTAGGKPVLLQDSEALCTPSGTGLKVVVTQLRVKGT